MLTTTSETGLTELSVVAGLAMFDSVAGLGLPSDRVLALKWPNDLLVDGAKVGGLLIECEGNVRPHAMAVGFGVNLVCHPPEVSYPTTDLSRHGVTATPGKVLERLAEAFARWLAVRDEGKIDALHRAWSSRLAGIGQTITVNLAKESLTGTFVAVDVDGGLVLRLPDGSKRVIMAGDVFLSSTTLEHRAGAE